MVVHRADPNQPGKPPRPKASRSPQRVWAYHLGNLRNPCWDIEVQEHGSAFFKGPSLATQVV